jgi:FkbM family methyltransferase
MAKFPRLYATLIKLKNNYNVEKVLFLNLIKRGDVVFDIGANEGYYTLLFSHLVGKEGKVHAFEPCPAAFKTLSERILNSKHSDNAHINNKAVGDANKEVTLYMPGFDTGQTSLVLHKEGSWKNTEKVNIYKSQMIKLDDYISTQPIKRLDFIKCDTEGAELLVVKGALRTITEKKPIIALELYSRWTRDFGYEPADLLSLLRSLGYSEFYIIGKKMVRLNNQERQFLNTCASDSINILCAVSNIHARQLKRLF